MKSPISVVEMRQRLGGSGVLSAYIATEEHDPAQRDTWRVRLDTNLAEAAAHVPAVEVAAFEQARDHLVARIDAHSGSRPPASVVFATARGVELPPEGPLQVPDLVRWRRGPVLGPWLRALCQRRDLLITLIDSRRARIIEYRHGELEETVDLRAHDYIDDLTDRNMSKRGGRFSGVRGETATDAADRMLEVETEKLLGTVADQVLEADGDAVVVIGGASGTGNALLRKLLDRGVSATLRPGLQVPMSLAELRTAIESAAGEITAHVQETVVREVLDLAGASVRAVLGDVGVSVAAQRGQVDTLLLTSHAMEHREDVCEDLIGWVLETGGEVEVPTGEPARLLDEAGGIGATLRYALRPVPATGSNAVRAPA